VSQRLVYYLASVFSDGEKRNDEPRDDAREESSPVSNPAPANGLFIIICLSL
jgi:hypothetical protein